MAVRLEDDSLSSRTRSRSGVLPWRSDWMMTALQVGPGHVQEYVRGGPTGRGQAPPVAPTTGINLWLECARDQIGLYAARVETHANIADGPSRGDFSLVARLGARARVAKFPPWAHCVWVPRPHMDAP